MVSGCAIWKKYQDFERELLDDFCEQLQSMEDDLHDGVDNSAHEHKRRKERFINSYSRQLSLPLIGNEATLKDFESELSVYCVESDVHLIQPESLQRKIQQATKDRIGRQDYEIAYHSDDQFRSYSHQDKMSFWYRYIEFEMKQLQYSRVQRLYERALLDIYEVDSQQYQDYNDNNINSSSNHQLDQQQHQRSSSISLHQQYQPLWLDYISFALCNLKNIILVNDIIRRALRIYKDSIYLWKLLLYCMESTMKAVDAEDKFLTELQIIFSSVRFSNLEEYYDLYMTYCNYCRRKLQRVWDDINYKNSNQQACHGSNTIENSNSSRATGTGIDSNKKYDELLPQLQASINQLQASFSLMTSFLTSYCLDGWVVLWWKWCLYQSQLDTTLLLDAAKYIMECNEKDVPESDQLQQHINVDNDSNSFIIEFSSNKQQLNKPSIAAKKNHKGSKTITTTQKKMIKTDIWEVALKHFTDSSFLHLEYISFLRRHREYEQCRRMFTKLMNIKLDISSQEVCKYWINFEQEYGTLSDVQSALIRTYNVMKPNMIISTDKYATSDGSDLIQSNNSSCSSGGGDDDSRYISSRTKRKLDDANNLYNNNESNQQQQNIISNTSTDSIASNNKKVSKKKVKFAEQDVIATFDRKSGIVVQSPVKPIITKHTISRIPSPFELSDNVENHGISNNYKHQNRGLISDFCDVDHDRGSRSIKHDSRNSAISVIDKSGSSGASNDSGTTDATVVDVTTASTDVDSGTASSKDSFKDSSKGSRSKIQVRNFSFTSAFESMLPFILDKCHTILPRVTSSDVHMILSKAGKSRGMIEIDCPVDCTTSQLLQLQESFHDYQFNDRKLVAEIIHASKDVSKPSTDKVHPLSAGSSTAPHLTTVFVKGFSAIVTEDDLKQHFDRCGSIIAAKVSIDKKTGVSKV